MPLFCQATFVNSFLILFAFPSLTAAVGLLYLDRFYHTGWYNPARGGDPIIWQHLFWFFGHPEVYILILPAFGMMSEIVPIFSRKPLFGRTAMIISILVIGFLELPRVGPPHVHGRPADLLQHLHGGHQHADRHPDRREDLQLAGDHVGRLSALQDALAVRLRA